MAAKSDTLVPSQSKNIHIAELLIEMVRNYLVLHDKRHPKHKDSLLKDDLWNKIGNELGLTERLAETVGEVQKSIEFLSAKYDSVLSTVSDSQAEVGELRAQCESLSTTVSAQDATIHTMNTEINALEQYTRRCNFEIHGLPIERNENLMSILGRVAESLESIAEGYAADTSTGREQVSLPHSSYYAMLLSAVPSLESTTTFKQQQSVTRTLRPAASANTELPALLVPDTCGFHEGLEVLMATDAPLNPPEEPSDVHHLQNALRDETIGRTLRLSSLCFKCHGRQPYGAKDLRQHVQDCDGTIVGGTFVRQRLLTATC
ncbi:hypothetical protein HPB52_008703 [Rhipicephalus sanguineus]|uniref:MADF domain-containing protein n=1 Tax=Rhipicephalus sanguineus TaxID=34632 RepID=A0A9D4PVC1_RHISA|nr:hypothetical protein HPB52_008703 [Rhipicephalus sanguineus]